MMQNYGADSDKTQTVDFWYKFTRRGDAREFFCQPIGKRPMMKRSSDSMIRPQMEHEQEKIPISLSVLCWEVKK